MNKLSKLLSILILPVFLSSCSHLKLPANKWKHEYRDVDKRVMRLVKRIESYAGYRMPFLKIRIVNFKKEFGAGNSAGGVCHMYTRQISLPSERWFEYSEVKQEEILLHEIGHCVFGRKHIYHKNPRSCPHSLMNWSGVSERCYLKWQVHYIKELFNNK